MSSLAPFLIRLCLVVIFPFSTLDKIFNWDGALKQANSCAVSGGPKLLYAAMVIEVGCSILVVAGAFDRAAATMLAFYCVMTAILCHRFWACGDFFASGDSRGRAHFWDFLKNFGLAGGLGLIILGSPLVSVHYAVTHPFSSTSIYQGSAPDPE